MNTPPPHKPSLWSRAKRQIRLFNRKPEHLRRRIWVKTVVPLTLLLIGLLSWGGNKWRERSQKLSQPQAQQQASEELAQASLALSSGKIEKAVLAYDNAVRLAPHWYEPFIQRGFFRLSQSNANGALADFQKAFGLGATLYSHAGMAEVFLLRTMPHKAESHARAALNINPALISARVCLSRALAFQGKFAAAKKEIEKAQILQPNDPLSLTVQSDLNLRMGDAVKAEKGYRHALKLAPNSLGPILGIGESLFAQKKSTAALNWYRLHLKPPFIAPVANNLAMLHLRQGSSPNKAFEFILIALKNDPGQGAYKDTLGRIYLAMSRPREALPWLRQAMEDAPYHPAPRYFLANALARSGRRQQALKVVNEGLSEPRMWLDHKTRSAFLKLQHGLQNNGKLPKPDWGFGG